MTPVYKTITAGTPKKLAAKISRLQRNGWNPDGEITRIQKTIAGKPTIRYSQTISQGVYAFRSDDN